VKSSDDDRPASVTTDGGPVRFRLDLGYDGTEFSGWAAQPGRRTVEQTVAESLATVLRLPRPPALTVAGRTDAGVHATGQVAHVDLPPSADPATLCRRLAGVLPADVAVHSVSTAPPGFDARFSATGRRYHYRINDAVADPLRRRDTLAWPRPLDPDAMTAAAAAMVGEHDFAAFCRRREGATTIRTLHRLEVSRAPDSVLTVTAAADGFCHNQVRAMVGALIAVGEGRRAVEWPGQVLVAGIRDSAVSVAPPHGLTLVGVDYPPDDELAARAATTRSRRSLRSDPLGR
jgi:tRNA pseudouridine38-40 synthase